MGGSAFETLDQRGRLLREILRCRGWPGPREASQGLACSDGLLSNWGSHSSAQWGGASYGGALSDTVVDDGLLNSYFLAKAFERVLALQLLQLLGRVLVEELVDGEVAAAHPYLDVVLLYFDGDSLRAELVNALGFAHEHDLELGAVGVVVDVLGQLLVDHVFLDGDVDRNSLLEVDDVLLELADLHLGVLELLEELETNLIALVNLLLHRHHEVGRLLELVLNLLLVVDRLLQVPPQVLVLGLQRQMALLHLHSCSLDLHPVPLILLYGSLVLRDVFLLLHSRILTILKLLLEHGGLVLKVVHQAHLVIERVASGLEPLNLDVLVLKADLQVVHFLN